MLEGPTHVGFNHFVGNLGNPGSKGEMIEDDTFVKFTSFDPNDLTTAPLSGNDTPSTNWILNNDDGALQQGKLTQRHLDAAKAFMGDHTAGGAHENNPFFMYYASHANHAPYYTADAIEIGANGTPTSVPITGNTVAGTPIHVLTGSDGDGDGLPDPVDPRYPSNAFDNEEAGWAAYYEEDELGSQIANPASRRADMVHENDIVLGELMDYLEATDDPRNPGGKLIDNTLIIFTSDNGANLSGPGVGGLLQDSNSQPADLRGKKGTQWEGGTRVPFVAAWAGEIPVGFTSDALFGQADLYATFAEITGQELDLAHGGAEASDSESVLDALLGTATGVVRDTDLVYKRKAELIIRRGDYKLITTESDFDENGERIDPGGLTTNADWQDLVITHFFDLSTDLDESNNRLNDPTVEAIRDEMFASLQAIVGPNAEAGFSRGVLGDVNHDGVLDADDWAIVRVNFGSQVLKGGLAAYRRGDLSGDNEIGLEDIAVFRQLFELANGAGSFAAMTRAVPEPTSWGLLAVACVLFIQRRKVST